MLFAPPGKERQEGDQIFERPDFAMRTPLPTPLAENELQIVERALLRGHALRRLTVDQLRSGSLMPSD